MDLKSKWGAKAFLGVVLAGGVPLVDRLGKIMKDVEYGRLIDVQRAAVLICDSGKSWGRYCNHRMDDQIAQVEETHRYRPKILGSGARLYKKDMAYVAMEMPQSLELLDAIARKVEREIRRVPGIDTLGVFTSVTWKPAESTQTSEPVQIGFEARFDRPTADDTVTKIFIHDPVQHITQKRIDAAPDVPRSFKGEPGPDTVASAVNTALEKLDSGKIEQFRVLLQRHLQRAAGNNNDVVTGIFRLPSNRPD